VPPLPPLPVLVHVPPEHAAPGAQTVPHAPQFAGLADKSAHAAPHCVSPAAHDDAHAPRLQKSPCAHAAPHCPQ